MRKPIPVAVWALGLPFFGAVSGCGDGDTTPSIPEGFLAGSPVEVSGESPFWECTADADLGASFWANSEVEVWIAVNPTDVDHIAVAWQQDRYDGPGSRGNLSSVTFDGGDTWSEPEIIPGLAWCSPDGTYDRVTDPWLAFAANGDLYSASLSFDGEVGVAGNRSEVAINKSPDGGLSWGDSLAIEEVAYPFGDEDKQTITAHPSDPCTLYVIWTRFFPEGTDDEVLFSRTVDCGETWSDPVLVHASTPGSLSAQIVVLSDGTLVAAFAEAGLALVPREIYVKRSTDNGSSWPGDPIVVTTARFVLPRPPDGDTPIRAGRMFVDMGIDRRTDELYLVWENLFGNLPQPLQIALSSSADGGLTWSEPIQIDRTPPNDDVKLEQAFLPSVEVSEDGTIGISYYNFENDTAGDSRADSDVWFIHCHPDIAECLDASNWSGGIRLTPESFDYLVAPRVYTDFLFLGDYVGLASSRSDFVAFFAVTTPDDPANGVFVPIIAD